MWFLAWLGFLAISFVVWYFYKMGPRGLVVHATASLILFWGFGGGYFLGSKPEVICKVDFDQPLRQEVKLNRDYPTWLNIPRNRSDVLLRGRAGVVDHARAGRARPLVVNALGVPELTSHQRALPLRLLGWRVAALPRDALSGRHRSPTSRRSVRHSCVNLLRATF